MSNPTKLIELGDGLIIQVNAAPDEANQVSSMNMKLIQDATVKKIIPVLTGVCDALSEAWQKLGKKIEIEQAEVELAVGFSAEGDIYIAKVTGEGNLTVKLTLKSKP